MLLSICIPTYNGGNRIKECLERVFEATKYRNDVEVIVSDNGSTDNTNEIINSYLGIPHYYVYRNLKNLGFFANIKMLVDSYAKGRYCWIIGDDDYIDIDAIDKLCYVLKKHNPMFISINHRNLNPQEFRDFKIDENRSLEYKQLSYFACIDENVSSSNVLGTFMSSQVFLLEKIRSFDKSIFSVNTWSDFQNTFPNSYMMTSVFYNSSECCCIKTPLITAITHLKAWNDKMSLIVNNILPDYYSYCISLNKEPKELIKTNRVIRETIIKENLLLIRRKNFSQVRWRNMIDYLFIKMIFNKIKRIYTK